jgi:uncharacterized protein HemY
VTWREAIQIIHSRETCAARARVADQASHAAGIAFHTGDYAKASRLLAAARHADPTRAA